MTRRHRVLTVTPNTALDITYTLPRLRIHGTNRAETVTARAGGKGLNVARVVAAMGHLAVATGPVGGATGAELRDELARSGGGVAHASARGGSGVTDALFPIAGSTRRTVTLLDGSGDATIVNEPGPEIGAAEWAAFREHYRGLLDGVNAVGTVDAAGPVDAVDAAGLVDAVALCGSLPPGVPVDGYALLIADARERGIPVLLDSSGPALAAGLAAGPDLVKPNAEELAELTGSLTVPQTAAEAEELAVALRGRGARTVVASLGAAGLVAIPEDGSGTVRVAAPERIEGNPIGAGDSVVAGLLTGMVEGLDWTETLRRAVALSAATVASPVAGAFDPEVYAKLLRMMRNTGRGVDA